MTQGSKDISLIECINPHLTKWRVRWNIHPDQKDENMVTFEETEFLHKPTIEEIKTAIIDWYNEQIDQGCENGFVWNEHRVKLSLTDQFNYKSAYDLAFHAKVSGLEFSPIKFKFEDSDGNISYYTFLTFEELQGFYVSGITYIQNTLEKGWETKDSLDFSEYERLLNDIQIWNNLNILK